MEIRRMVERVRKEKEKGKSKEHSYHRKEYPFHLLVIINRIHITYITATNCF